MLPERNLDFDTVINRKNTDCLKYDFAVRRGKPADVLPLWVADMDFKTSSRILDAITERTAHGIFGYTEVSDDYFGALAGWMKKHHDLTVEPRWLLKTPGVVFVLAAAVRAFTDEGDYVLLNQPVYYPMKEVIEDNGRRMKSSDLVLSADGRYTIDLDDFERKIVRYKVKVFILCNPHNPVGRVWTKEELSAICDICIRNNVLIVSDEIHEDFVYPGYKHQTLFNVDERIKERAIVCTSPSKTFNLAGLQIANSFIPDAKIRRAIRKEIAKTGYSQLNTLGLTACKAAYLYGEEWYEAVCKYIYENLLFLKEWFSKNFPEVSVTEPEGTYLVWLDFRALKLTEEELEDRVVNCAGLWLDPGAIFGQAGEGFERINIACSRSTLSEALERLRKIK